VIDFLPEQFRDVASFITLCFHLFHVVFQAFPVTDFFRDLLVASGYFFFRCIHYFGVVRAGSENKVGAGNREDVSSRGRAAVARLPDLVRSAESGTACRTARRCLSRRRIRDERGIGTAHFGGVRLRGSTHRNTAAHRNEGTGHGFFRRTFRTPFQDGCGWLRQRGGV